MPNFRLD